MAPRDEVATTTAVAILRDPNRGGFLRPAKLPPRIRPESPSRCPRAPQLRTSPPPRFESWRRGSSRKGRRRSGRRMGSATNSRGSAASKPRAWRERRRIKPSRAAVVATSSPGPSAGRERPSVGHPTPREPISTQRSMTITRGREFARSKGAPPKGDAKGEPWPKPELPIHCARAIRSCSSAASCWTCHSSRRAAK
jgi:hypothetical protein